MFDKANMTQITEKKNSQKAKKSSTKNNYQFNVLLNILKFSTNGNLKKTIDNYKTLKNLKDNNLLIYDLNYICTDAYVYAYKNGHFDITKWFENNAICYIQNWVINEYNIQV